MRALFSILLVLLLSHVHAASASTWEMDIGHANIEFRVQHMMISTVKGVFRKGEATLKLDDQDISKSSVTATIDVSSLDTNEHDRDEHLLSPDFFDAKRHPTMTFRSKKVEKFGQGYKVSGDLSIRGITRPVVLEVTSLTEPIVDPWGNRRRGIVARTTINRKDFGMVWNKAMDRGGYAVGDEVRILIEAEFVEKKQEK